MISTDYKKTNYKASLNKIIQLNEASKIHLKSFFLIFSKLWHDRTERKAGIRFS